MENLNKTYWNKRYLEKSTGWDIGYSSTPLTTYFDQIKRKDLRILIPGAGNSYEAEYLFQHGFSRVYIADWAEEAMVNFKKRVPSFPESNLLHVDFFNISKKFDLIIEQTFFCAINPSLRADYARKMAELIKGPGKLVGVLFNIELNKDHPPFGGNSEEYYDYFSPYFNFNTWEPCYNSIEPRAGEEWFINLARKRVVKFR